MPDCTVFSSIGVVTVSTSRVVMVMFCDHKPLKVQIGLHAMNADIGDGAARRDNVFANHERRRNADRFDRGIDAAAAGHFHDLLGRLAIAAVDGRRGAKSLGDLEPAVVEIDHDDFGR